MSPRRSGTSLTAQQARWLAIAGQGLAAPRPKGPVTRAQVRKTIHSLGALQLDAINVLERTQFLVLFSRLGPFDSRRLHRLNGPGGDLFEYWAHAACLIPIESQPLYRWRMDRMGELDGSKQLERRRAWLDEHADYVAAIVEELHDRGPLTAGQLSDPRRNDGEWWDRRSDGRIALELLFAEGRVAGWRLPNFERVYDVPERVIPADVLAAPTPTREAAHLELVRQTANALGVATVKDLSDYYYLRVDQTKAAVAELVAAGDLVEVQVEGWSAPGYVPSGARLVRPKRTHATLLSPFDSLVRDRDRTLRLFDFFYRIEVYTPAAKRVYGYFVLPILLGDQLVGRLDLKADRKASVLRVQAAHAEDGADLDAVAAATAPELDAMRGWLGLDDITVAKKGDLAPALRRAISA